MLQNPWERLGPRQPYAFPEDLPYLLAFNDALREHHKPRYGLDLSLPPEPFLGPHDAPLVVLLANPGRDDDDPAAYARPGVTERSLANAASPAGTPHHFLTHDAGGHPGSTWWRRKLKDLLSLGHSYDELAHRVLAVQLHGYHSRRWRRLPKALPSQPFAFGLVRQAIERKAVIVMGRCTADWHRAVPELATYEHVARQRSVRTATVSRGNLDPSDFEKVAGALAA
ncbi:hypothetical protein [Kitasatospora sp. NPDC057936]|uniref:hypothetical protein n=1 Tax=Kitasatospora sp. NPDC057936 TaxID=3346283 RepID=UPI0036D7D4A5